MAINSKAKGARGEREFAKYLKSKGLSARRGQQYAGGGESPDVVCEDLPTVHFEVKRKQASQEPYQWLQQAIKDCTDKMPIVAHRRNARDWIAILRMEDLIELLKFRDLLK